MRGKRASALKPLDPSGPFGARIVVKRGALSSMELILIREIKRSGRGEESWILTTPQADVLPVRYKKMVLLIYFLLCELYELT
jgi:hypothetical protein